MKADHVTMIGMPILRCANCSELHLISERITAAQLADIAKGYVLMHAGCRRPELKNQTKLFPGEPEDTRDLFAKMYPLAIDANGLISALRSALTKQQFDALSQDDVRSWDVRSGIFDAVANWARCKVAAQDAEHRAEQGQPGIPGLYIPTVAMPEALISIMDPPAPEQPKGKRAKKSKDAPAEA